MNKLSISLYATVALTALLSACSVTYPLTPIAHPDTATTTANTAGITIDVLANDEKGDESESFKTYIFADTDPKHPDNVKTQCGTVSTDKKIITYTPPKSLGIDPETKAEFLSIKCNVSYTIMDANGDKSRSVAVVTINKAGSK